MKLYFGNMVGKLAISDGFLQLLIHICIATICVFPAGSNEIDNGMRYICTKRMVAYGYGGY